MGLISKHFISICFSCSFLNRMFFLLSMFLTGTLWNLSSYEPLKMVIINHALQTMTNEVIIPHSGWEAEPNEDSKPRDAQWTTVFKNTSGCLRYSPAHTPSSHNSFIPSFLTSFGAVSQNKLMYMSVILVLI